MAVIRHFSHRDAGRQRWQDEAIKGEVIPLEMRGEKFLQLYSSGSENRMVKGQSSQNLRISREAFEQLVEIGRKHFGGK